MQGIFRKENTDKALKYGIYRHLPTYEKIIRNLVSFLDKYICVTKLYMGSVLLLQINYCRDMIINIYCIERSGV